MGTHQELEMFGSQPAYPEKLLHKKESLQNQLINIRVELSQASTVTGSSPAPSLDVPCPLPSLFSSFPAWGVLLGAASSCFPGCSHSQSCCQPWDNPAKTPLTNPSSPFQALANSTAEYESLESEVSTLHDDLWEQLNLDIQVSEWCPHHPHGGGSPLFPSTLCSPQGANVQVAALCSALGVLLWPGGLRNLWMPSRGWG